MSGSFWQPQSYPPPTELPAMRAGEVAGRYMDCSTALGPISDAFIDITTLSVVVTRMDGQPVGVNDLQLAPGFAPTLDATGMIATWMWIAPAANVGTTYYIALSGPTASGETFVRDWRMSIVPLMG